MRRSRVNCLEVHRLAILECRAQQQSEKEPCFTKLDREFQLPPTLTRVHPRSHTQSRMQPAPLPGLLLRLRLGIRPAKMCDLLCEYVWQFLSSGKRDPPWGTASSRVACGHVWGAFSLLMIDVEVPTPLWVVPPGTGRPDCIRKQVEQTRKHHSSIASSSVSDSRFLSWVPVLVP